MSRALLLECERAKERLSTHPRADISLMNPETGETFVAEFTRSQFEGLLEANGAIESIRQTVRRALESAIELGNAGDDLKEVLLVGGSSQIPLVQARLGEIFGPEKVRSERTLDAVARGAAAFAAGVDFHDHIQHDYAIRWANPRTHSYDYRTIVKRGTPYPTPGPVDRLVIKATYEGQKQLGIAIIEVGHRKSEEPGVSHELLFDPSGAARVVTVTAGEHERRAHFWLNEHSPTFLVADPPGLEGEPRFEVEFGIDGNKRLLITARDLNNGRLTHKDFPVVKLS